MTGRRDRGQMETGDLTVFGGAALAPRWRTSHFVFIREDVGYHDLIRKTRDLSQHERTAIQLGIHRPFTFDQLVSICNLSAESAQRILSDLSEEGWIVLDSVDESTSFQIHRVDIETFRQCNARCGYCPQSTNPKPRGVMEIDLFGRIAASISPYQPWSVALNHYGEPLLDPFFRERCDILKSHNLLMLLFTNGTQLDDDLCKFVIDQCQMRAIVFNYPSADPAEWSRFMRIPKAFHRRVTTAIRRIAERVCVPVVIDVNGITDCHERRTMQIQHFFRSQTNIKVERIRSNDRAGSHQELVAITKPMLDLKLAGCERILCHMHVRYDGAVYLCCQDYEQRNLLGNIVFQTPAEIMGGAEASLLRSQIFGMVEAPANLICRSCSSLRRRRESDKRSWVRWTKESL